MSAPRAACAALVWLAGAAAWPGGPAAAMAAAAPRMSIEPPAFDFGRAQQQRVLKKQFRIRNFGEGELVIGEIRSDCGCTAALLAQDDRRVAPGGAVTLHVSFETRGSVGRVVRRVLIRTNDPERAQVELRLEADVRRPRAGSGGRRR